MASLHDRLSGLDNWLSRGLDRVDDEPEPDPETESLLTLADAEIERELTTDEVVSALDRALDEAMRRHEQRQDAHLARWLVETNGGGDE